MRNVKINIWKICLHTAAFFTAVLLSSSAFAAEPAVGMAKAGDMHLQAAASPVMERMTFFHDKILMPIIISIALFVLALLIIVAVRFNAKANPKPSTRSHNVLLEIVWTLVPILILLGISVPSMKMLYFMDKTHDAEMTLKATGNQWYWDYAYPDNGKVEFSSQLIADEDLKEGQPRLLATDNPIVLPVDTNIRVLLTANDVIHSWAVPSLGVKTDAVPGRLNETWIRITKEGTFYGQCSEICGRGHGYMPIEIKAVSKEEFDKWIVEHGGSKTKYKTDK